MEGSPIKNVEIHVFHLFLYILGTSFTRLSHVFHVFHTKMYIFVHLGQEKQAFSCVFHVLRTFMNILYFLVEKQPWEQGGQIWHRAHRPPTSRLTRVPPLE